MNSSENRSVVATTHTRYEDSAVRQSTSEPPTEPPMLEMKLAPAPTICMLA